MHFEVRMFGNPSRDGRVLSRGAHASAKTNSQRGMVAIPIRKGLLRSTYDRAKHLEFQKQTTGASNKGPVKTTASISFGAIVGREGLMHLSP
jgi:uncharacterized membrane-anchored protein